MRDSKEDERAKRAVSTRTTNFDAESRRKKAAESIPEAPQFATGFWNLAGENKKQIGGDFNKKMMAEEIKAHAKKQNHTPSKADVPVDKCGVPKETAASLKVCCDPLLLLSSKMPLLNSSSIFDYRPGSLP